MAVTVLPQLPMTSTGKADYAALADLAAEAEREPAAAETGSVRAHFTRVLGRPDADAGDSFVDLGGDSLSYVELATRLADTFGGAVPPAWHTRSIGELERLAAAVGDRGADGAGRGWARLDTTVGLRALAILFVVASHVDLVALEGGAHLLLALAGYNFARFQLSAAGGAATRLRHGLSGLAQLIVPSVLWVGAVAVALGSYDLTTALFVRELLNSSEWDDQWQLWFLESLVWLTAAALALTCLPVLHRLERRTPFRFALALLAVTAAARFADVGLRAGPTQRYTTLVVAFVFVLGWLGARADTTRRRVLVSVLAAALTIGFFGQLHREAIVLGGFLLMLWLPHVAVPSVGRPGRGRARRRQPLHLPDPLAGLPAARGLRPPVARPRRLARGRHRLRARRTPAAQGCRTRRARLAVACPAVLFPAPVPPTQESRVSLKKVLIANRGEIAVRVVRACKDAGIGSVAVYADPDRDALFVRLADEAHSLGGATPAESYLDIAKIIAIAEKSGADSIHPGYGFLAENADFAQAVIDAGLIWIGPPPAAIEALGDKAKAKHIADRANAPLAPGTKDPVKDADEVVAFAEANGLPVAIKAVFGGGGRGLKVARTLEEIPDAYESAVREAVTAFGRGECLVEKFLDKPRHVETQCLADQHGNVVVVSTRDCSLQRRNQKLVEEAPAPFLTDEQVTELYESSKRILTEAGYYGAGTCEFLVAQDGTISFLEVNTRLQVEHCVSEEVTGIDLVREMFRIAAGEELGYGDPEIRGHSIEFRINAEDGGRNFMPAPGTLSAWSPPSGPGVRLDGGYENGETIPGSFDSLIAKLIVTGTTRTQALERSRRALDEFVVDGMPTVIPFHRAVVRDPAFVGASTPSDA